MGESGSNESFRDDLNAVLNDIGKMLLLKNKNYGDSVLNPLRIFSRAERTEQIRVRIDDKLSRLSRGERTIDEDTVNDLIGYLLMLKIVERRLLKLDGSENGDFEEASEEKPSLVSGLAVFREN